MFVKRVAALIFTSFHYTRRWLPLKILKKLKKILKKVKNFKKCQLFLLFCFVLKKSKSNLIAYKNMVIAFCLYIKILYRLYINILIGRVVTDW